jgi:hypothetical protein
MAIGLLARKFTMTGNIFWQQRRFKEANTKRMQALCEFTRFGNAVIPVGINEQLCFRGRALHG